MTLILPLNLLFFMKVAFLLVFEYFQIKLCFICKIMMNITCLNYCMKSATQKFPGEVKLLFFSGGSSTVFLGIFVDITYCHLQNCVFP